MKRTLLILIILFALVGTAGAADGELIDGPITTNVMFCKLHLVGDSYEFEPMLTLYQGKNDWGRYTFLTGAANLTPGDYALVQINEGRMDVLDFIAIDYTGTVMPAYTLLTLELREDELAGPLGYYKAVSSPAAGTTASDLSGATPVATTAKSPASPLMVLAGLGIVGILCAVRVRR